MLKPYNLSATVNEEARCIVLTVTGKADSVGYVDDLIALLESFGTPWLYDLVCDFRFSGGLVHPSEVYRLLAWGREVSKAARPDGLICLVSLDPFFRSWAKDVTPMFPAYSHYICASLDEAMEALSMPGIRPGQTPAVGQA